MLMMMDLVLMLVGLLLENRVVAFFPQKVPSCASHFSSDTKLKGIHRIFYGRRKRNDVLNIESAGPIRLGDLLPDIQVKIVKPRKDGKLELEKVWLHDLLPGKGTNLLIGIPGAISPVPSQAHLSGYVAAAPLLDKLGINKVALITTSDHFIRHEWAITVEVMETWIDKEFKSKAPLVMISDTDAELIRYLGLIEVR